MIDESWQLLCDRGDPTRIGTIENHYGPLLVSKPRPLEYAWGIENYNGTYWERIPHYLYQALLRFQHFQSMDYDNLSSAGRELLLTIEHTDTYYKSYFEPMARNLSRRHKRGEPLDLELAIRGFMHGVNLAAKTYRQEHGSMTTPWHKMFPISDRRAVAEQLAKYAITEIKLNGGWS